MLDVVFYENDKVSLQKDIKVVNQGLMNIDIDYHISLLTNYNNGLDNFKLFIINVDNNGLELAKLVRDKYADGIILLLTDNDTYSDISKYHLMFFDYIVRCDNYEDRLKRSLLEIIDKFYCNMAFTFKYNYAVYRLPYKSINYIEKETNIKRCIIHTENDNYYIISTIDNLLQKLGGKFIKTHQSCIVNTRNIKALDSINNSIVFNNGDMVSLINDSAKRKIKEWMISNSARKIQHFFIDNVNNMCVNYVELFVF